MLSIHESPQEAEAKIRHNQRALWSRAASGRREAKSSGAFSAVITERIIEEARIGLGMRVLDVACGIGDPAISIARSVGSTGEVVGVDLTPAMVAAARAEAASAAVENVHFQVIDDEKRLPGKTHGYDAITCRFGLMFMPNPLAALVAWRKALKADGRISICTHAALPSFQTTMKLVEQFAPEVAHGLQWRDVLSLSSVVTVSALLAEAGFSEISVSCEAQHHVLGTNVADCWDKMVQRSPLYRELKTLPSSVCDSIQDACIRTLSMDASNESLAEVFGGTVLFARATNIRSS